MPHRRVGVLHTTQEGRVLHGGFMGRTHRAEEGREITHWQRGYGRCTGRRHTGEGEKLGLTLTSCRCHAVKKTVTTSWRRERPCLVSLNDHYLLLWHCVSTKKFPGYGCKHCFLHKIHQIHLPTVSMTAEAGVEFPAHWRAECSSCGGESTLQCFIDGNMILAKLLYRNSSCASNGIMGLSGNIKIMNSPTLFTIGNTAAGKLIASEEKTCGKQVGSNTKVIHLPAATMVKISPC